MTELGDVTDLLQAFESHNNCRLEVRLSVTVLGKNPTIEMVAIAHPPAWQIGEVSPLGSVSFKCSALNLKTLMAALTHAMYALDFQLAENEFKNVYVKRA
jgi:hypothetical protein